MKHFFLAVLLLSALVLSGCTPETVPLEPTPTPSLEPTRTATIEWFPATPTSTRIPTQAFTPTPELPMGLGGVLLQDDFTGESFWQTGVTNAGNILLGEGTLNLSVQQPRSSLTSLRSVPEVGDFYLQITASPGLCAPGDQYGIYFRAVSPWNGYRLLADCAGQVRLERIKDSAVILIQDWTPLVGLQPLDFFHLQLGIWAAGTDIRLYARDILQFTAHDPVFTSGRVGAVSYTHLTLPTISSV